MNTDSFGPAILQRIKSWLEPTPPREKRIKRCDHRSYVSLREDAELGWKMVKCYDCPWSQIVPIDWEHPDGRERLYD